jgi:PAS domain S-box-containing protein
VRVPAAAPRRNLPASFRRTVPARVYFRGEVLNGRVDLGAEQAFLSKLAEGILRNGQAAHKDSQSASSTADVEARYRALVEQIPAVVFTADLDQCLGRAYISPHIEVTLGFSRDEWLEDPILWYQQIHPDDKDRCNVEAAEILMTGKAVRSCYRVLARDGHVVWFQCEANIIRHDDGRPWFIHGIAFDITELKRTEEALAEERNVASAILDSVGTLVVVLDPEMRIVRFNRMCEEITGYSLADVRSRVIWDLMTVPEQADRFRTALQEVREDCPIRDFEVPWERRGYTPLDLLVDHRFARRHWRSAIFHRGRHRHHGAESPGDGRARNQRPRAAANRAGLARRSRPTAHRYRFHEQGSGRGAGGEGRGRGCHGHENRPSGQ